MPEGSDSHQEEVKLGFVRLVKRRRSSDIGARVNHLSQPLIQLILMHLDLLHKLQGLIRSTNKDAVVNLVLVVEPRARGELLAELPNRLKELRQAGRVCRGSGGLLGFGEEPAHAVLVDGSLGEAFGYDGGLLPFDAVHELDEGMEEAWSVSYL